MIESSFDMSDPHIHTSDDKIKYLSFDHMLQHARMTTGLALELALADFPKLEEGKEERLDCISTGDMARFANRRNEQFCITRYLDM